MLALQNTGKADLELPGLTVGTEPAGTGQANFDLSFNLREAYADGGAPAGIDGALGYRADLFEPGTARSLAERLVRLLRAVTDDPDAPLLGIDLLDPVEEYRIVAGWNDTAVPVVPSTLPELFADAGGTDPGRAGRGVRGRHPDLRRAGRPGRPAGPGAGRPGRRPGADRRGGAAPVDRADRGALRRAQGRRRVPPGRPGLPGGPGGAACSPTPTRCRCSRPRRSPSCRRRTRTPRCRRSIPATRRT